MGRQNTHWIEFRGQHSSTLGVQIVAPPIRPHPARRGKFVDVPGRDGSLWLDDQAYERVQIKVPMRARNTGDLTAIDLWLTGAGDLRLSSNDQYVCRARAVSKHDYTRFLPGTGFVNFEMVFDCDPFLYQANPQATPLYEPFTLANPGALPAEPLLRVYGRGNVVLAVGDVSITLTDLSGAVAIDCDAKLAYTVGASTPVAITLNDERWPVLGLGGTRISWSGQVEKVIVEPNWRWL